VDKKQVIVFGTLMLISLAAVVCLQTVQADAEANNTILPDAIASSTPNLSSASESQTWEFIVLAIFLVAAYIVIVFLIIKANKS
jgi:hypothetical protein